MASYSTFTSYQGRQSSQQDFFPRISRLITTLAERLGSMLEKRRSRLALLELTEDQLKDIGLSQADAYREGVRPFWN